MSRVVMFVFNAVTHDTRVLREAATLRDAGHDVTIIARPRDALDRVSDELDRDGIRIVRIPVPHRWRGWWRLIRSPASVARMTLATITRRSPAAGGRPGPIGWLVTWRYAIIGWGRRAGDRAPIADIYHGHDLSGVVAAEHAAARNGGRIVYDSHELFVESRGTARQPEWARWFIRRLERRMLARADAVVTVNAVIADELARRYDPRPTVVVHNCPPRWTPPPAGPDRIRAALGIEAGTPVVLCHGGLHPGRGLEETIEAMALLADLPAHLVFLGYGPSVDRYAGMAERVGIGDRFHLLDAVEPEDVLDWVSGADVDAMVIQPTELNTILSTPNKLFESLAAGVPVVSSDFPSRRRIVVDDPDGPLGAVCDPSDVKAIAAAIRTILELDPLARADLRARCLQAAHDRWNWETESAKLVALYAELARPVLQTSDGSPDG